jgi:ethanolamine ammonia-lyase small subunit
MAEPPVRTDFATRLRAVTQARIALGRAGQALPTSALLDFQLAHARARDAVGAAFDTAGFSAAIGGRAVIEVASRAPDHAAYLQRPDLGRRLDETDARTLTATGDDVAFIVGDGLSATAVEAHAAPLLLALFDRLPGWRIAPVVLARRARVALGDEIGALLGVDLVVMLIGERPGLSAPDSLGAYLTWQPRPGRLDSERNCVSNIRPPHGLSYAQAADGIAWLMKEARSRRLTGVALKDESEVIGRRPGDLRLS